MKYNNIDDVHPEQMACYKCGHIAPIDEPYECEYPDRDTDSFPICPACGHFNIGGYECYAPWSLWPEDFQKEILNIEEG